MKTRLGWRCKFGVIIPSTNTVVEPELAMMAVPGISVHTARLRVKNPNIATDEALVELVEQLGASIGDAVFDLASARVNALIMGVSLEALWDSTVGIERLQATIREKTSLTLFSAAQAYASALKVFGAKKIAVVTPYQPIGNRKVIQFFNECGIEVVQLVSIPCTTATAIAEITGEQLVDSLLKANVKEADALVQCGTNLCTLPIIDAAEHFLKKPIVAANAATWWHALRENHINDKIDHCGRLLREF